MDDLQRRIRANAAIDSKVAAAASRLEQVAVTARKTVEPMAAPLVDLGDGSTTPPRHMNARQNVDVLETPSRSNAIPGSPVSPAVRAATNASAIRRAATRSAQAKQTAVSIVSLRDEESEKDVGFQSAIPRLSSRRGASASATHRTEAAGRGAEDVHPDLPAESQLSLLRSQLRIAKKDHEETVRLVSQLRAELTETQRTVSTLSEEKQRLLRAVSSAETGLDKAKKISAAAESRETDLRTQIASLQKELTAASKHAKPEPVNAALEARLNRALEEIDRLKSELSTAKTASVEQERSVKDELAASLSTIKKLERQRTELVIAFKKQLKLIDILKRQRVHMEAARLLAFTEEEFMKLMEMAPS